jgi:hypothetical protein
MNLEFKRQGKNGEGKPARTMLTYPKDSTAQRKELNLIDNIGTKGENVI